MSLPYIGSYHWTKKNNGILTKNEKCQVVGMLIRSQIANALGYLQTGLGFDLHKFARINLNDVVIPDSTFVKKAEDLATVTYSPALYNHCLRTYYFSCLFAQYHNLKPDLELLYTGCLFHDFGLADSHVCQTARCGFHIVGARQAQAFAVENGWDHTKSIKLYESISYHLNPYVPLDKNDSEASLLQRGAMLDVIGLGHYKLGTDVIVRVEQLFSRENFKREILDSMKNIQHVKDSHADFLGRLGFEKLASNNKLDNFAQKRADEEAV